jgi:hypothetical protein
MTNKQKKCSASLVIKEMHFKVTLRFLLTPIRMAIIKKTNNAGGVVGKRNSYNIGENAT